MDVASDTDTSYNAKCGTNMEEKKEDKLQLQDNNMFTDNKQQFKIITVKTKTEDGGSPQVAESDGSDAFSRWSNTNARMTHLLTLEGIDPANEDNTDWKALVGYQGFRRLREGGVDHSTTNSTRKTRLSTELHDSVFYEQLFGRDLNDL